ncbi:MAG TPA: cytochrome C biogenesis protein ResC [Coriobacteriia bacterium]|nr:MAG: ResC/HemX-like, no heme-binding motif [Actinobacteria bacterium 66_15]HAL30371.1 cytochrome C biogenesis protein ResC [Coriobacteriia bacterium]
MEQALAIETPLHVFALVAYAIAAGCVVFGVTMSKPGVARAGHTLALVGLAVHSVALGLRWYGTGHGPYLTRYEVLSSNAWVAMTFMQALRWRRPGSAYLTTLIYPAVLLLLGLAVYTGPEVQMLPLTFRGVWLVLHVCFYFVAFAAALISLGHGALYIARDTTLVQRIANVPDAATLDRESYRFAGLTFAFWGIGMLTGAIWAYYSWGRFWGWDPIETWSLVTWFVYGIYLHARRFYGMKGRSAAMLLMLGFVLAILSLFFTSFLTTSLHSEYFH